MRTVSRSLSQSMPSAPQVLGEVDRAEVADRGLAVGGDLDDLGAQVGQVDDGPARGVAGLVAGAVAGVLEGHPAVAGLGEGAHHLAVQVAGLDLPDVRGPPPRRGGRPRRTPRPTGRAARGLVGVDQRPVGVGLDAAHELVGDPVGEVEVVGAPGVLAGVVAQLEELLDVGVPRLEVDAGGALAPAALVDRGDRRVEGAQERHDAVGLAVGAADQRAAGADPGEADADAAGELRQLRHLGVARVDRVEVVARAVDEVARRHLGVPGAGVEQRRRARQVGQRRHQPVEPDRLAGICASPHATRSRKYCGVSTTSRVDGWRSR